jgi:hypothetical protein
MYPVVGTVSFNAIFDNLNTKLFWYF